MISNRAAEKSKREKRGTCEIDRMAEGNEELIGRNKRRGRDGQSGKGVTDIRRRRGSPRAGKTIFYCTCVRTAVSVLNIPIVTLMLGGNTNAISTNFSAVSIWVEKVAILIAGNTGIQSSQ